MHLLDIKYGPHFLITWIAWYYLQHTYEDLSWCSLHLILSFLWLFLIIVGTLLVNTSIELPIAAMIDDYCICLHAIDRPFYALSNSTLLNGWITIVRLIESLHCQNCLPSSSLPLRLCNGFELYLIRHFVVFPTSCSTFDGIFNPTSHIHVMIDNLQDPLPADLAVPLSIWFDLIDIL